MIQRIELWDFESHEHTVLEDISPALNLLCGDSNSGKTSIVRAIKLAAYNQFDPRSVRIGATKCVVQVDTERGRVKVTRGPKHNLWEVTQTGQQTQYFDKVGVNVVPEAAAIIGLNIVTLGDVEIPVNIMDQLESHFMLSGVGDKSATGSVRAQIIDEISGLSGIEGLIKDVSLDHLRRTREINETEKRMEETRKQLHPQAELDQESGILREAEGKIAESEELARLATGAEGLLDGWNVCAQEMSRISAQLLAIPNTDDALESLGKAESLSARATAYESLVREYVLASKRLQDIEQSLSVIPDTDAALVLVHRSEAAVPICMAATELFEKWNSGGKTLSENRIRTAKIDERVGPAQSKSDKASEIIERLVAAEKLLFEAQRVAAGLMGLDQRIKSTDDQLRQAEQSRDAILASVTTCPLTLKPISKQCLEDAKT